MSKKKPEGFDFNDIHCRYGLGEVRRQWDAFMANVVFFPRPSDEVSPEISAGAPTISDPPPIGEIPPEYSDHSVSPAPSEPGSDSNKLLDEFGRYSYKTLIDHFWYVWGTRHAWDNINQKQIELSHLRHGVGRERYKLWDESSDRRWVKDIVFSPDKDMGHKYVNLYTGFNMTPDSRGRSGCARILHHIYRLCGLRDAEFDWLMRWIAYPLQNPGAKMASSVIMYGSEGPGKSIVWEEVVKKIYGEYSVTIGQAQLESQFTGWKSRRLFALAEEVVSRSERNHHKGVLKQTVTGSTHMINEKMLPEREESNHMNFVFLSNSTVPLELDMGDRRYLVLYVDKVPEKQYFVDLFDEIANGGVECFYHHLLNLDMGDFSAHTKPPVNQEKEELIDASLPSPAYFHKLWKQGELDIPYKSAVAGDLFKEFQRWCERSGEFKRTERYFGAELKRVMLQVRHNIKYPEVLSSHITKRIYVTEDDMNFKYDRHFAERLGESCREFRMATVASSSE
ncbi:primase-helicase family protein [Microbulbifer sp. CnH-101-E]|uniref:primase-helicase family protein n=1 Tax=unclassified Microbulbifer TaxID=2619833 RepID=UPI004039F5D9